MKEARGYVVGMAGVVLAVLSFVSKNRIQSVNVILKAQDSLNEKQAKKIAELERKIEICEAGERDYRELMRDHRQLIEVLKTMKSENDFLQEQLNQYKK